MCLHFYLFRKIRCFDRFEFSKHLSIKKRQVYRKTSFMTFSFNVERRRKSVIVCLYCSNGPTKSCDLNVYFIVLIERVNISGRQIFSSKRKLSKSFSFNSSLLKRHPLSHPIVTFLRKPIDRPTRDTIFGMSKPITYRTITFFAWRSYTGIGHQSLDAPRQSTKYRSFFVQFIKKKGF